MHQTIQLLLKGINVCSSAEKAGRLTYIGNYMRSHQTNVTDITEIAQRLVNILSTENDLEARQLLFGNIFIAYAKKADLATIQLTPIVNMLDESGPAFICNTLHLLSMTSKKKYYPVISRYIYYPDEKVREEAVNALTFLQNPQQLLNFYFIKASYKTSIVCNAFLPVPSCI